MRSLGLGVRADTRSASQSRSIVRMVVDVRVSAMSPDVEEEGQSDVCGGNR